MSKQRKKPATQLERRYLPASQSGGISVRKSASGRKIVGYAAKFGVLSEDLGGFREKLDPHCFDASLATNPDVRCLFNHDTNQPPLGRTSSGTLRLKVDSVGLFYECDAADNQMTRDILVSLERGDISQSSFGFLCDLDSWDQMPDGSILRTVLAASLFDVSPVNFGAYPDATSGVRAALRSAPDAIRAKLNVRNSEDDDPDDHIGQHWDAEQGEWADDDDSDDSDDDESEDFRCSYRCMACRSAELAHLSNLAEDNPAARSKKITRAKSNLSEDDLMQEAKRCAFRCDACRSLLSGHFPTALAEDDADVRAHAHLLSLRR
jgi:HK97 family phage prohead protease